MPYLIIDIQGRYAQASDALTQVQRQATGAVNNISAAFSTLKGGLASIFAGLSFGAVVAGIRDVADQLDDVAKASQAVGLSTESLSALRYAASFAGLGAEELDRSLAKLTNKMSDVAKGNKEAEATFKSMGVNLRDAKGEVRSVESVLYDIANAFQTYADGANKTALASDLFGEKIGPRLIPFLNAGAAGIKELTAEAEKLGLVIGQQSAKDAERFNDELERLGKALNAIKIELFSGIVSKFGEFLENLRKARAAGLGLYDALNTVPAVGASPAEWLEDLNRQIDDFVKKRDALKAPLPEKLVGPGKKIVEARNAAEIQRLDAVIARLRLQADLVRENYKLAQDFPDQYFDTGGKKAAPAAANTAKQAAISEGQKYVDQLQTQIDKTQELTAYEEAQLAILRAKKPFTEAEKEKALALAQQLDIIKEYVKEKKKEEEFQALIDQAQFREQQRRLTQLETLKAMADPLQKYVDQINQTLEFLKSGDLTQTEANGIVDKIAKSVNGQEKFNDELAKTEDIGKRLGLTFESTFEKILFEGGKVRDLLAAIAIDFAKAFVRKNVTTPLLNFADKLFTVPAPIVDRSNSGVRPLGADIVGSLAPSISQTIYASGGVSPSEMAQATVAANDALKAEILDSRLRGGVFS